MMYRHALETDHSYAIVFIINFTKTIWRPMCLIGKHMARERRSEPAAMDCVLNR